MSSTTVSLSQPPASLMALMRHTPAVPLKLKKWPMKERALRDGGPRADWRPVRLQAHPLLQAHPPLAPGQQAVTPLSGVRPLAPGQQAVPPPPLSGVLPLAPGQQAVAVGEHPACLYERAVVVAQHVNDRLVQEVRRRLEVGVEDGHVLEALRGEGMGGWGWGVAGSLLGHAHCRQARGCCAAAAGVAPATTAAAASAAAATTAVDASAAAATTAAAPPLLQAAAAARIAAARCRRHSCRRHSCRRRCCRPLLLLRTWPSTPSFFHQAPPQAPPGPPPQAPPGPAPGPTWSSTRAMPSTMAPAL